MFEIGKYEEEERGKRKEEEGKDGEEVYIGQRSCAGLIQECQARRDPEAATSKVKFRSISPQIDLRIG